MNALNVHGGAAVLERISDKEGSLAAGEPARGIAKLAGRDVDIAVSVSQSSQTEGGGDIALEDGVRDVGELPRNLDFPIISVGGFEVARGRFSSPRIGLQDCTQYVCRPIHFRDCYRPMR